MIDNIFHTLLVYALVTGFFVGVFTMVVVQTVLAISRSRRKPPLRRRTDMPSDYDQADWWKNGSHYE